MPGSTQTLPNLQDAFDSLLRLTEERVRAGIRSPATLEAVRVHVRFLLQHVSAKTHLADIDEAMVSSVLSREQVGRRVLATTEIRPIANVTLRKRASTFRHALRLAHRQGLISRVPAFPELPHRYTPRNRCLTFGELEALMAALPQHRREWVALAVWTGQRRADVEAARREDLDLGDRSVVVRSSKTKQPPIRIAAAAELVGALRVRYESIGPGDRLVEPWPHVSSQLTELCRRRGWARITANTFRHTFFTWAVATGGMSAEVQRIGGWTTPYMLLRVYAHAQGAQFRELVDAMSEFARGGRRPPSKTSLRAIPHEEKKPHQVLLAPDGVEPAAGPNR